ncbi:MAG: RNA-directed DNA polymerase [Desulfobacterium sp.]|nr:RNA-directed DNA polymerase [Desulfobacterium sp.]
MSENAGKNLFAFPIDIRKTLKHLRQDMKDDWFYDTVRYEDLLSNSNSLNKILQKNLEINHGVYESGKKFTYDVPKSSLGLRYTLEIDFYDRFIYQSICTYLMPFFDPLLSNRVLSHRYNKHGKDRYLFKHRIELWNTFENISHLAIDDGQSLLVTDMLNYFEHISINAIENAFIGMMCRIEASGSEKNKIRSAISTLRALLEKWCFNDRHGLPQNRDASSFIANVVLDRVDKKMVDGGFDYFRYVDDVRIICANEFAAKRALNTLILELRKFGLNINSKKTAILDSRSEDIEDFFPSIDDRISVIDTMWRSRSKKVIARSVPVLHEFLMEQLKNDKTQGRPFRFCINRFKTLISSNLFDSKSVLAIDIADAIIREFACQPVSTDQFCKLLMDLDLSPDQLKSISDYIMDSSVAIYGWQNYHIFLLLAYKKYSSIDLIEHCKSVISADVFRPEVPACFIYLASVGHEVDVEGFIDKFEESWPYQHKRFFLISLQNTPIKKLRPMFGKVDYRLRGTVTRLKGNGKFKDKTILLKDFNSTLISEIYDEISPYE